MSDETNVTVRMEDEKPKRGKLTKAREWIGGKIAGKEATQRMEDTWNRIHRIGGFLPIFIEGNLELRTQKQQQVLDEVQKELDNCEGDPEKLQKAMYKSNVKVFNLFHTTGSQWMRGLENSRFAKKIRAYLELFQRIYDDPAFTMDLFTCSMAMLNYSWKPEDVGSVPPYLIETKTVIQPTTEQRIKMDEAQVT